MEEIIRNNDLLYMAFIVTAILLPTLPWILAIMLPLPPQANAGPPTGTNANASSSGSPPGPSKQRCPGPCPPCGPDRF